MEGQKPWRELLKKSPKTAGAGVLIGGGLGLAVAKVKENALGSAIENRFETFKQTTHQMELAWRDSLEKRAAAKAAAPEGHGRGK